MIKKLIKKSVDGFFRTSVGTRIFFGLMPHMFDETTSIPQVVRIESSNLCNGKCVFCPHIKQTRKKGNMNMELYEKIITECAKYGVKEVHLQNFGEPLFDKNLFRKIKIANKLGIKTVIFSNASLFDDRKIEECIDSGLDEIFISFEGYNKRIFQKLRPGLEYDNIQKNIQNISILKKRLKSKTPKITLNVVCIDKYMLYEADFRKRWRSYVDVINFQKLHNWSITANSDKIPGICNTFWNYITISWDGKALICCLDWDARYVVGDTTKEDLIDIWNNDKYKRLRNMMLHGKARQIPLCNQCSALNNDTIYTDMIRFFALKLFGGLK